LLFLVKEKIENQGSDNVAEEKMKTTSVNSPPKKHIIVIDNHTRQLKSFFKNLLFKNYPVVYFTKFKDAEPFIKQNPASIIITQLLLYDSDISEFQKKLRVYSFEGPLIVVNTNPLAEKAIQTLKFKFQYFIRDLNDIERVEYMIKLFSQENSDSPLELSPFVQKDESYKIMIPSDLYYIDRVVRFVLKKVYAITFNHQYDNSIRMAMVEAISNAIEHGNRFEITRKIEIQVKIDKEKFYASVADEGEGFNVRKVRDLRTVNREFSDRGRGIFIINKFMDRVWHNEKGNIIYLEKYFDNVRV